MTTLAFIGFGEAAQVIAAGLRAAPCRLLTHDIRLAEPAGAHELAERMAALEATPCRDLSELEHADMVLSLVTGAETVNAAAAVAPHLASKALFIDLNSVGPKIKREAALAIAAGRGRFVDGAVMAPVAPHGRSVPIVLSGPDAGEAASRLNDLGMNCEVAGDRVGQASALKMIRSLVVKGIEGLLIEALTAAERAGVTERILDSVGETFPGLDWRALATYYIGRTARHGPRRLTEMEQVAETFADLGTAPRMARAAGATIGEAYDRLASAGVAADAGYAELLSALAAAAPLHDKGKNR